jgi:hypothetical protein
VDAVISLASAAIHVVTICQSFGAPALLNVEKEGVHFDTDGSLANARGQRLRQGDWVTISSARQTLYAGKARFKPARLMRYMRGEEVKFEEDERDAFEAMAYAYRYYHQLVRSMELEQISTLKEIIRLVNLELRGEAEEARRLVNGWFDVHQEPYVRGVLESDLGDHLNQATAFDLLTLDRKIGFFRLVLQRCRREAISGNAAGAFMLGRFIAPVQPVDFWAAFQPAEVALLLNEWLLFEKYMQVLHEVGERRVLKARKKILAEGLGELELSCAIIKPLVTLKLCGTSLDRVAADLPEWADRQTATLIELLKRPYGHFYDYQARWSLEELERLCAMARRPVPAAEET